MKYGPQTEQIEELLNQIKGMTCNQARDIRDAYDDQVSSSDDHSRASTEAYRTASKNPWWEDLRLLVWVYSRPGTFYCLRDVMEAVASKDELSEGQFDTLYGPWRSVMG